MNSQPLDLFEPPDDTAHRGATGTEPTNPFFDRAGLAWIAACVAIAVAAGRWIPPLSEPGAWGDLVQAVQPALAAAAASHADRSNHLTARKLLVDKESPAKPAGQLQRGIF